MISSSSLVGSGFHRGSRDQLAGGDIPHVVSASSDIFPTATASGVLADAGLSGFVPVRLLLPFCISDLRCCHQCRTAPGELYTSEQVCWLLCRLPRQCQSRRCSRQRLLWFRRPLSIASMHLPTSRTLVHSTRCSKSWSNSHSCCQIHFNVSVIQGSMNAQFASWCTLDACLDVCRSCGPPFVAEASTVVALLQEGLGVGTGFWLAELLLSAAGHVVRMLLYSHKR